VGLALAAAAMLALVAPPAELLPLLLPLLELQPVRTSAPTATRATVAASARRERNLLRIRLCMFSPSSSSGEG
jgi:hypothetical protein